MGQQQCPKCGEAVDAAKAFCPACGNAIVAEKKRTTVSDFDKSGSTVQLDKSMYNQLLSDMGLSISTTKSAGPVNVAPVASVSEKDVSGPSVEAPRKSSSRKWLIAAVAVVLVLGLLIAVGFIAALVYTLSTA